MKLYVIPHLEEIDKWISLSKEYNLGFEYNEFFNPNVLDNEHLLNELITKYKDLNRNADTLHGVFFDINLVSNDQNIKEVSLERVISSLKIAEKLKCKGVVFHTNYQTWIKSESYKNMWIKESVKVYKKLLDMFPNLDIYVENMFDDDPMMLSILAEKLKDEKHFGVCLDVAHAFISNTDLDIWFNELKPYIKHIHLNDNDKNADLHLALGEGCLNIEYVFEMINKLDDVTVLLEMNKYEDVVKSLNVIKKVQL